MLNKQEIERLADILDTVQAGYEVDEADRDFAREIRNKLIREEAV